MVGKAEFDDETHVHIFEMPSYSFLKHANIIGQREDRPENLFFAVSTMNAKVNHYARIRGTSTT